MAGPATNLATLGAIHSTLGRKSLTAYLVSIVGGSLALGWAFDFVLESSASGEHSHHMEEAALWESGAGIILVLLLMIFALESLRQFWREKMVARDEALWLTLPVEGMTCQGCVGRLEKVLRREEHVEDVLVQLDPGQAKVKGAISKDRLQDLIQGAGFEVPVP